jgi:hypothetical protein
MTLVKATPIKTAKLGEMEITGQADLTADDLAT